jgi:hypothetical protein
MGILELLTYLTAANLDGMHVDTPIRAGNAPGEVWPPLSRKSPGEREESLAHARNNGPQLNARPSRAREGQGTDREERLLRLVDILRAEQLSASMAAKTEVGTTDLHRWRWSCLWAIVAVLMGAVALLLAFRPTLVYSGVRRDLSGHPFQSDPTTKIVQSRRPDGTSDADVSTDMH